MLSAADLSHPSFTAGQRKGAGNHRRAHSPPPLSTTCQPTARVRFEWYVAEFSTVEVNSSFYHWPRDSTFAGWKSRLPQGFRFSVKAPRGLTHGRRLLHPEVWAERIRSGLHELGHSRGALLVQLPPDLQRDDLRLDYFLRALPVWVCPAVEFRHPSWVNQEVFELLVRRRAAYAVMSGAGLPCILRATAEFVYVRLHGPDETNLYGGSNSRDDLRWWADRIAEWADTGRYVYVYFNNDGDGNAVRNARDLRDLTCT